MNVSATVHRFINIRKSHRQHAAPELFDLTASHDTLLPTLHVRAPLVYYCLHFACTVVSHTEVYPNPHVDAYTMSLAAFPGDHPVTTAR